MKDRILLVVEVHGGAVSEHFFLFFGWRYFEILFEDFR